MRPTLLDDPISLSSIEHLAIECLKSQIGCLSMCVTLLARCIIESFSLPHHDVQERRDDIHHDSLDFAHVNSCENPVPITCEKSLLFFKISSCPDYNLISFQLKKNEWNSDLIWKNQKGGRWRSLRSSKSLGKLVSRHGTYQKGVDWCDIPSIWNVCNTR